MKSWLYKICLSAMLAVLLGLLLGCGNNAEKEGNQTQEEAPLLPPDPVTLTLFPWNPFLQSEVELFINQPLQEKYPHIKVELLDLPRNQLENLITAGNTPDLIATAISFLPDFQSLDLIEDLTPLLRKHNVDMSRFDPMFVETEWLSNDFSIYGLPYNVPFGVTYYNKTLYDEFGVPFPREGLTWEDAIELGRLLSRTVDGVDYIGFSVDSNRVILPLGQAFIDPATNRGAVSSNDLLRRGYEIYQRLVSIPGNFATGNRVNMFLGGRTATYAHVQMFDERLEQAGASGLDWDVTQFPSHEEPRGTYPAYNPHVMIPTKTSRHLDEAVQVLDLLTSVEVQKIMSAHGKLTPLNNAEVIALFGTAVPFLEGKSVASIFKSSPAKPPVRTIYDDLIQPFVFNQAAQALERGQDVNTVIREIDEKINLAIRQAQSQ